MAGGSVQGVGAQATAPPIVRPRAEYVCPARHCWVSDAADRLGQKRPGLLLEWRPRGTGWEGRVVYAARLRPDTWCLVEEWVPAALLTP